jgi:peptide/nickel transport system substrate-binding protein
MLVALLLSACGGGEPKPAPPADGAPGEAAASPRDTLVVGWISDVGSLNSIVYVTTDDADVINTLRYPMVDYRFEDCQLGLKPAHATEWTFGADGKSVQMTLRDDLKWEDGQPVTLDDLTFTFELVADPAVASPRFQLLDRLDPAARPKVIDPTHIEWGFLHPFDQITQLSSVADTAIVPKHVLGTADRGTLRGNPYSKQPLSYGPWRVASYEPNQRLVLEPNPNFTGPEESRPKLARIVFRVIPEYSTRLLELEAGKIDHLRNIQVGDADRLRKEHPEIKLYRRGWRSFDYVVWNFENPLFQDVNVRNALAMAVDADQMIARLLTSETGEKYARRAVGNISPAHCRAHNDDLNPIVFNPQRARDLLAQSGWTDTDNDGVLDKDGKKFEFTLSTNAGNKRRTDAQVLIQAALKEIGVVVNLEQQESNALFENMRKRQYEAALSGWSAALYIDPSAQWMCDQVDEPHENNFGNYCNPEVDKLIEQALATPKAEEAAPLWKEVQAKVYADQPYLFLYWMDEIVGLHRRFDHAEIDLLTPLGHLERWEVPPDKVKYK